MHNILAKLAFYRKNILILLRHKNYYLKWHERLLTSFDFMDIKF